MLVVRTSYHYTTTVPPTVPLTLHTTTHTGVAGLLYVTTGIHGGHVLVGMILILLCTSQWLCVSLYSASSTDCIHGVLSVVLYWHFVDLVWISVVYVVYCGQLVMMLVLLVTSCPHTTTTMVLLYAIHSIHWYTLPHCTHDGAMLRSHHRMYTIHTDACMLLHYTQYVVTWCSGE